MDNSEEYLEEETRVEYDNQGKYFITLSHSELIK